MRGVEKVLKAFRRAGCTTSAEERAVEVIRDLGGYTSVARDALERRLKGLSSNPRMVDQIDRLHQRRSHHFAEMRRAIQTLVSQVSVVPVIGTSIEGLAKRVPFAQGAHPEATLIAKQDRFAGRIDLLIVYPDHVDIIDFKTGKRSDNHVRQLQLYGLLWCLDEVANPNRLPIGTLRLGYIEGTVEVAVPKDWDLLQDELHEEIVSADRQILETPPLATPSIQCWHCPVRQMCDEYWQSSFVDRGLSANFTDAQVRIVSRNGPTSWVGILDSNGKDILVRTASEDIDFVLRRNVRLLDVVAGKIENSDVEDSDVVVLTFVHGSEVFGPV